MKKLIVIVFLLLLAGCQGNKTGLQHENRFDNNPNLRDDIEMYNDDKELPSCFEICHNKIQDICMDDIVELEAQDIWYGDSILDTDFCEQKCTSWTDDTLECMAKATKCESVSSQEPYCREEEDNSIIEYIPEKEVNYGCSEACYKYKRCALMADDATQQDGNEAYNTCFNECQNWSEKTLSCIKEAEANTPMGCAKLSACGIAEYSQYLK